MRFLRHISFSLLPLLLVAGPVPAGDGDKSHIVQQKRELEQIRQDMESSQNRLDSLRALQLDVQKEVSEYDQKLASDRTVISRLNSQLGRLKDGIGEAEESLTNSDLEFDRAQRRYLGNIRQFYMSIRSNDKLLDYNPNLELERHREVVYLTALAELELEHVAEAGRELDQSTANLVDLTDQRKEVASLKEQKEVSYSLDKSRKNKQEKNLDQLRRRSLDEAERVMTLKMAAEEMENIIARLEEERQAAQLADGGTLGESVFAGLKGQLRSPYRGKITTRFGELIDPVTKLKSFSPGITIKGSVGRSVYTVATGTVAYTGDLRGYGKFVIINHDNQYYTTYAGLGRILVTQGQHLPSGAKLAGSGDDGVVKFELRKGREPLTRLPGLSLNHFDITQVQANAWSILSRSFRSGKVASTYLIYGQSGVGHWPLALDFAALLNCAEPQETDTDDHLLVPCRECRNCRLILGLNFEGLYPIIPIPTHKNLAEAIDLTSEGLEEKRREPFAMLTSAANLSIPISMAREVAHRLSRKGDEGVYRVVLFYQMERMKPAAADALLKLIEEPPPETVIILTAERPERLLPTIQSRAQKVRLSRLPEEAIVSYLVDRYDLPKERATLLSRLSEGVMGQALAMAIDSDDEGASLRAMGLELFQAMFSRPGPEAVALITENVNPRSRGEVEQLLKLWQSLARDAHYLAHTDDDQGLTNIDFSSELRYLSPHFANGHQAGQVVAAFKNALADSGLNVHIHTALAALSFKLKSITTATA